MPSTINGVGTTYAGKKNVSIRRTACPGCGREAMMESYDTRLFFCFLFIPLIPLKKLRVLDMCPSCRVHRVVNPAEYEAGKQLHVSGALDEFRRAPTAENAVKVHAAMLAFHENDRAAEFRREADSMLGQDAQFLAAIGSHLVETHQESEATGYFERAYRLRPDMPQARIGVAIERMRQGQLEEARALLDFLEKPGAGHVYDLVPLLMLAERFQGARKHEEALQLLSHALSELPHLKDNRGFREAVKLSEKAVRGGSTTLLPKQTFSLRRVFSKDPHVNAPWVRWMAWATSIAIFASGAALIYNDQMRRHRDLYVVNALADPVEVSIDGGPPLKVAGGGAKAALGFAEGKHHITVTGASKEEHDVELVTPFASRWGSDPVWVLNVGQAAPLIHYTTVYSKQSYYTDFAGRKPVLEVLNKQPVTLIPHVDYVFSEPPENLRVDSKNTSSVEKHCLKVLNDWGQAAGMLSSTGQAYELLQWCAVRGVGGESVLRSFFGLAGQMNKTSEALKSLQGELEKQPLRVELHRAVQEMDATPERRAALSGQYDGILGLDPRNASAIYLKGRLASDPKEAHALFEKAREADPSNPWPCLALGYEAAARAEWEKAAPLVEEFVRRRPHDYGGAGLLFECNLGRQSMDDLEKSLNVQARSKDILEAEQATIRLVLLGALKKEKDKAKAAIKKLATHGRTVAGVGYNVPLQIYLSLNYAFGEMDLLLEASLNAAERGHGFAFVALCEKRLLQRATTMVESKKLTPGPLEYLALTVVADAWKNPVESARWKDAAAWACASSGDKDDAAVAAVLRMDSLASLEPVLEISWTAREKALLCVVLASRHESLRTELLTLARKLNVLPAWPYHIVRSATESL